MKLKVALLLLNLCKFALLFLLLVLGASFGILAPFPIHDSVTTGLFKASYKQVTIVTLSLYFLYRTLMLTMKFHFDKQYLVSGSKRKRQDNKKEYKNEPYYRETIRLLLIVLPIAIGYELVKSPLDSTNNLALQVIRLVFSFVFLSSVYRIYSENVNFTKAEESYN